MQRGPESLDFGPRTWSRGPLSPIPTGGTSGDADRVASRVLESATSFRRAVAETFDDDCTLVVLAVSRGQGQARA